jgi:hypothetical protein
VSRVGKTWRVEVEWTDSQVSLDGWVPVRSVLKRRKKVTCHSVGYVLVDDKAGIVLAGSVNGANATGVITIPASQIVKRWRLRK